MIRALIQQVNKDLDKKMVILAGPRQCGKTTLALQILNQDRTRYLNWDEDAGKIAIIKREFPTSPGYLVLDEIHKYAKWRNLLKGLFDARKNDLKILVTGSAKLEFYRKGGDSLQGRYFSLRLHPLTFGEIGENTQVTLEKLFQLNGFPEPFLSGSTEEARRWSRDYRSRLIREELVSLEKVSEVSLLEELSIRLPECVSSPLSLNALREDLQVSHQTVNRWLSLLDRLYAIFRVIPFGSSRIKALKKESKHYHWDWNIVQAQGPRFENFMACHLLSWCQTREDVSGYDLELRFFKDREQREVDFVIQKNREPLEFIECKYSPQSSDVSLRYLKKKFPKIPATQVCFEPRTDVIDSYGIRLCDARTYLWELNQRGVE